MKIHFHKDWDEEKISRVIAHYEHQSEDEAIAEDEAVFEKQSETIMEVPIELVPVVRELIAKQESSNKSK